LGKWVSLKTANSSKIPDGCHSRIKLTHCPIVFFFETTVLLKSKLEWTRANRKSKMIVIKEEHHNRNRKMIKMNNGKILKYFLEATNLIEPTKHIQDN
jgi:hypothetical protein